jgi:hypothetical protein
MHEKLKSYLSNDQLYFSILTIIVGITAFGLGRWSVLTEARPAPSAPAGVVYHQNVLPATTTNNRQKTDSDTVMVVASRSGSKYHLPSCPGATQIKPENLIEFNTIELAKAAGYAPAANCAGLQ